MVTRTCPDWPMLMELDPNLQFKHYSAAEAKLAAEVLMRVPDLTLPNIEICCDLDHHVFYREHTHPELAAVLGEGDWFEVRDWAQRKREQPRGL
jgi:hypothetical protein